MRSGLRTLGNAASAVALTAVLAVAFASIVVPKALGAMPYTVLSGSMRPTLEPGSLIIVRPTDADHIDVGDVITYQVTSGHPEVVTHRVVGVGARSDGERTFTTRGDANNTTDPDPIRAVQIRGVVLYHLPWLGHLNSAIDASARSTLSTVVAGATIAYGIWLVTSDALTRRQSMMPGSAASASKP